MFFSSSSSHFCKTNRAWKQEIANPGSAFRKVASHSIILVHCMYSSNRTPKFATGLLRYFARPNGQTVVILTGGFHNFQDAAIAAGRPDLRESFSPNPPLPEPHDLP
jgi:hypothetical protein